MAGAKERYFQEKERLDHALAVLREGAEKVCSTSCPTWLCYILAGSRHLSFRLLCAQNMRAFQPAFQLANRWQEGFNMLDAPCQRSLPGSQESWYRHMGSPE